MAADVNRDGRADLAVSDLQASRIRVFLGNGNGTFATAADYAVESQPEGVVAADINGDGHVDLAAGNLTTPNLSVLLNNGNGTFATALDRGTSGIPAWVVAGDFNRDGSVDLAAANSSSSNVALLLNTGVCPWVEYLYPAAGSINGDETTTVHGARLLNVNSVTMGGLAATLTISHTDTQVSIRTPAHAAGDVIVVLTSTTGRSEVYCGYRYLDVPAPPPYVVVSNVTSTHVTLYWDEVPDATEYQIDRQSAGGGFVLVATVTAPPYDNPISVDSAYLYRIRTVSPGGVSTNTAPLLAGTVMYTTDIFQLFGRVVKAVDLAELRTAVNAVRALTNLGPFTFTDPAVAGTIIRRIHITELRTALNDARNLLSLGTWTYTDDPLLAGMLIKSDHHQDLRFASGTPGIN